MFWASRKPYFVNHAIIIILITKLYAVMSFKKKLARGSKCREPIGTLIQTIFALSLSCVISFTFKLFTISVLFCFQMWNWLLLVECWERQNDLKFFADCLRTRFWFHTWTAFVLNFLWPHCLWLLHFQHIRCRPYIPYISYRFCVFPWK